MRIDTSHIQAIFECTPAEYFLVHNIKEDVWSLNYRIDRSEKGKDDDIGTERIIVDDTEMEALAIKAAEALEIDVAGIDMVKGLKDGKPYVLEVNRAGSFDTFERVTDINVVAKIVEWLAGL